MTLADKVKKAGVVGAGGGGFPAHVKLAAKADTVIANGAECEPYLTSDFQTMLAYPAQVVEGARVMAQLVGVRRVLLGIEADKQAAIPGLVAAALPARRDGFDFEIVPCAVRYPQGAERNLSVSAVTRASSTALASRTRSKADAACPAMSSMMRR